MKGTIKRVVCLLLTICLTAGLMVGFDLTAFAADNVTVNIVSFLRGEQEDLRSSELLEARVEGYSGNTHELTYKWTNGLGTYLYVYNSHNMYGINVSDGEVEIYNSSKTASANMPGRSYEDTFSGTGYAWAAIYGADSSSSVLTGTVTVEVYDPDGNLLATDSHTGTREGFWFWQTYHGFVPYDLQDDLKDIHFGLFEGDTRNIQDLLGENGLLHVSCEACVISNGKVTSGGENISVAPSSVGTYEITGLKTGTGVMTFSIAKDNCKFHNNTSGTATATAYVYRKPIPSATTTTITLEHLDDHCTYYINGEKGVRDGDSITFTGLTPNTNYEIEVVGQAEGTTPIYAYVYQATLPLHTATLEVRLDGSYDSATATATGTLVNIEDMTGEATTLYLRKDGTDEYYPLSKASTGVYSTTLENGVYYVHTAPNASSQLCEQQVDIANADRTRYLFFFSVNYDANGGTGAPEIEYCHDSDKATVSDVVPTKDGYIFSHWEDQYGNTYQPGDTLTEAIYEKYTLTAQYVKVTDVYVNITINHIATDGHNNNDDSKHNIGFTLDQRSVGTTEYDEIDEKKIKWNSTGSVEGFDAKHTESTGVDVTTYTATSPTFTDVPANMEYTVTTAKSHYAIAPEGITQSVDANGNIIINLPLIYDPATFDLEFEIELDEEAKALPQELKPIGVGLKITAYHNHPHDGEIHTDWHTITAHSTTYARVHFDENGKGKETFPVPSELLDENGVAQPYYYRIEAVTFGLPDGGVMAVSDYDGGHTTYVTNDHRYWANIEVSNGKDPASTGLNGVWYENGVQNGSLKAVVSIEVFDVTFDPNGGVLNGSTATTIVPSQIAIPDLTGYIPTRDGGYVFDGWYIADENGNITEQAAISNEVLYNNVTLIAKWREPVTVNGTIAVAGVYTLEDGEHVIPDQDRIKHVTVLLQHIDPNGYAVTKHSQDVTITYNEKTGTGTYEFTQIPDDGDAHRILVISSNYVTVYQNEPESVTSATSYDAYDATSFTTEFDGDNTAVINAYLHFEPSTFDLKYQINAKAIAEGYIPQVAETLIISGDDGTTESWPVISQMIQNSELKGQKTEIIDGIGNNSYPVWTAKPDGMSLYQYSIRIDGYTLDGTEHVFDSSAPFTVTYNGSARYDAEKGQTQLLTATLSPRLYHVTFDVNAPVEEITGMDDYVTVNDTLAQHYYWSYGTEITAQPERAGYTFLGWEDADGNAVTEVSPSMAENFTLYAQWEAIKYTITTVTLEGGTTEGDGTYNSGDEVTITATPANGYIFEGWYVGEELVSTNTEYTVTVTEDKTYTAKFVFGIDATWHYDTDSGYFMAGGGKSSVVRFLFNVEFDKDISDMDVQSGIKFIKAENITEDIQNATMIDAGLTGKVTTFYGDITDIGESRSGETYIAVAYITVGEKTFWSKPLECKPDFNKLIEYN